MKCACGARASLLCDWIVAPKKTCDAAVCDRCALEVAKEKHLCQKHQEEYRAWKALHP